VYAQELGKPTGPVVLSVSGNISVRNSPAGADFDAAMLAKLTSVDLLTTSPWHKEKTQFSGPSLKTLLDAVGAKGDVLKMVALDKYEISMPLEDAKKFSPVLVRRINGKELTVRSKGPILLMFPFDQIAELRSDVYYSRSIWQLRRIVVE
jgi:hypothetical protein